MRLPYTYATLLISLVFCSGCGSKPECADELAPYLVRFSEIAVNYGRQVQIYNISLRFGSAAEFKDLKLSGYCKGNDMIRIDPEFWSRASEAQREKLIFHELGHCILGRGHSADTKSIMKSGPMPAQFYNDNREALLEELFTNAL